MIDKSEQINELAAALSKAQAKFKHVAKDKTAKIDMKNGGSYTYRYADLGSTWDVARAALTENGLSVAQLPSYGESWLRLDTILMHSSGQYISSQMQTRAAENDVKSIGSAITYLRRYAFASIIGLVADEDDDGDGSNASQKHAQAPRPQAQRPAATADRRDLMDRAMTLYGVMKEQGLKYKGKMFKDMDLAELAAACTNMEAQLETVAKPDTSEWDAIDSAA